MRSVSLLLIAIFGSLLLCCQQLFAEDGYKLGNYVFFITLVNKSGNLSHSSEYTLTVSHDLPDETETGSDCSSASYESDADSEQNGCRLRVSVASNDGEEEEEPVSPLSSSEENFPQNQGQSTNPAPFVILDGPQYTVAQDAENYATESDLPTVLMEYPAENPLTAISGVPLEQILPESGNPNPNALSQLTPDRTIMLNLPVIRHLATGIVVYPVFSFSAFAHLADHNQGSTLIAIAHPCVNCLCQTCSVPTIRPPLVTYCANCPCCPTSVTEEGGEEGESDYLDSELTGTSHPIVENGPVALSALSTSSDSPIPSGSGFEEDLSPPDSTVAVSPSSSLSAELDDISPPPEPNSHSSFAGSPGQGAYTNLLPYSPSLSPPAAGEQSCHASADYSVQIHLTSDNSAISSVSYHFYNQDVLTIHLPASDPGALAILNTEASESALAFQSSSVAATLDQIATLLVRAVLLNAVHRISNPK